MQNSGVIMPRDRERIFSRRHPRKRSDPVFQRQQSLSQEKTAAYWIPPMRGDDDGVGCERNYGEGAMPLVQHAPVVRTVQRERRHVDLREPLRRYTLTIW